MPRDRKRQKRGTWKGNRCWVVVLWHSSSHPFLIQIRNQFSQSSQTFELLSLSSKPNSFNCLKIIQMCITWKYLFPPFQISHFFPNDTHWIFVRYHTTQVKEKKGWGVFWKWNVYFCGYFNFLEMFNLFGDGWKISLNKVPYKYVVKFLSMPNV